METKIKPATPLPEIAVNINGDLGVKEWRRDPANGQTQRFTLAERHEVARRANAYPKLVALVERMSRDLNRPVFRMDPGLGDDSAALLRELGEES